MKQISQIFVRIYYQMTKLLWHKISDNLQKSKTINFMQDSLFFIICIPFKETQKP